ncbi:unnamed protein product [Miscanthus lutarioriparius]|uniref:Uncharacterized protein n=1 Tax=Miscanthus lutarioriparius TaxID=422564 RepID=A0A811PE92_9POAL|nr:unnamed protein product [Miscanthus lutarioriparius]
MAPEVVVVEEGNQQQEDAPPRPRPPLAVEALRDKIVEKVKASRVTLIVGDTGCGKSYLVPQFLLEENMEPILCTQPRRFAVVAIARAIAESRNWQLGEEVGYHIGHSNVSDLNSKRSKIVFKTAGVVLEQMCDRGIAALRYKVIILDEIADILKINSQSLSTKYCSGLDASADAEINYDVYELIHKLLLHIHQNEPDVSKSILVFLPTHYALEQQWIRLFPFSSTFKVHILHRSIDTDEALQTMKISKSCRKVILATNIAESSVTIPGVAYVIDSCRSLQVYWDPIRKTDAAGLVWISKSRAEQSKGRTGRTCDGQIYSLVTGTFYSSLNDHEYPAILRLSLREQVLMVCCAEPRLINDPSALLQRVLNPPDPDAIEDALESLVQIHALEITNSGRYLPLSFDSSVLALKFCELGAVHEGILISIMLDIQPLPIVQPFGYQALRQKYRDNYFKGNGSVQIGKKEATTMGNLCAFQFWERVFKDKHRLEYLKDVAKTREPEESHTFLTKPEEEWCAVHNLVPAAFKNVSEIYDDVMMQLHRFRPSFLVKINPPKFLQPSEFNHTCLCHKILDLEVDMDPLSLEAENSHSDSQKRCAATPYVSPTDFGTSTIVELLKTLVKEGCRSGNSCPYSHDFGSLVSAPVTSGVCSQEGGATSLCCTRLLPADGDGYILVMNDKTLEFSSKLSQFYDACKIVAGTPGLQSAASYSVPKGLKILEKLADPSSLITGLEHKLPVPWTQLKRVFWFADFDNDESDSEQALLHKFFADIAIKILSERLSDLQVILIMKNTRYIQLQVERLARECYFFLSESFMFDEATLGWFSDISRHPRGMQVAAPVTYVFNMHPPSTTQFGDYPAELREALRRD